MAVSASPSPTPRNGRMNTSPGADEKRLANIRAILEKYEEHEDWPNWVPDFKYVLRLLDAAQARIVELLVTYTGDLHRAEVRLQDSETRANNWRHDFLREEREKRAAQARASVLATALKLLVDDVADYPAWQRPCFALDKAREALSSTTPKCPEDGSAPQATDNHKSGDKG